MLKTYIKKIATAIMLSLSLLTLDNCAYHYGGSDAKIYAGGYQNGTTGVTAVAGYWNPQGVFVPLGNGSYSIVYSLVMSDNGIYAGGYQNGDPGDMSFAGYWKPDGTFVQLGDSIDKSSYVHSIAISGSYIYAGGYRLKSSGSETVPVAGYWRNSINANDAVSAEWTPLSTENSFVYSIVISDEGIYAAGNRKVDNIDHVAGYWKPDKTFVQLGGFTNDSFVRSCIISDNNIYAAGSKTYNNSDIATYWKPDRTTVQLAVAGYASGVYSIAISGDDIYAAGYQHNGAYTIAGYWKNSVFVELSDNALVYSLAISGNDIYAGGCKHNSSTNQDTAGYWENGTWVELEDLGKGSQVWSLILIK